MAASTPPLGGPSTRVSAPAAEPHGALELAVASPNSSDKAVWAGVVTWLVWTALFGAAAYRFARHESALSWNSLGGALALLGLIPAAMVTQRVSRGFERLLLVPRGLIAEGELIIDFARGVHAAVLELGHLSVLVIVQGENHVLLFARHAAVALGGPEAWGPRWHRVSRGHLRHRTGSFADDGAPWPSYFSVRGKEWACIAGAVNDERVLATLAQRALVAGAHGDWLRVPLTPHARDTLRVSCDGVVNAFGEAIATRSEFTKDYIWTWGKKNASGDADALVLRQDTRALCLSMVERPGAWQRGGSVLPAAAELPTPELPREQQIHPLVFGALDALCSLQKQRLRCGEMSISGE